MSNTDYIIDNSEDNLMNYNLACAFRNICKILNNIGIDVRLTARLAVYLKFDISTYALVIRAVQSLKCVVDCTSQ
jgi:hypothetical protein